MKQVINLIVVLTVICLGAGLALAVVNNLTADRIALVAEKKRLNAIAEVLPETGSAAEAVTVRDSETGQSNTFYVARDADGNFVGAAMEAVSPNGYGGDIRLMVGINVRREIQTIAILEQKETPGLGAKIDTDDFKGKYAGLQIDTTSWKVTKDGGDIDAITAATISSRAVAEAVNDAVLRFKQAGDALTNEDPLVLEELPDEIR